MSPKPTAPRLHWVKRIGAAVTSWAAICAVALLADMSPRPLLLAGLAGAVAVAFWLASDSFSRAEPTTWEITEDVVNRPRGGDARVLTLEHVIADSRTSAEARLRLHHILCELADERLLSSRGIDRQSDPSGARAALGPELETFITSADPGRGALPQAQISLLLNRIESL